MKKNINDIRQGLEERINDTLDEINELLVERDGVQARLQEAEFRVQFSLEFELSTLNSQLLTINN